MELRREGGMPQLAAYAEGVDLPEELVELLTDAFDEDGCESSVGWLVLISESGDERERSRRVHACRHM